VICRFCHFDFADSELPPIRCPEHDSPICPSCFCCQAVEPLFKVLAPLREIQRWRDAT
jgi:hypothetical protein